MEIVNWKPFTLVDYPGHIACTVFVQGCNLRCGYCFNKKLIEYSNPVIPQEEFFSFLSRRVGLLEGVVLCGGEPLLNSYSDVANFASRVKSYGFKFKLDTNGTFPQKLQMLLWEGFVDYVAMDVKAPKRMYDEVVGVNSGGKVAELVEQSVRIIQRAGVEHQFRTVLIPEVRDRVGEINKWIGEEVSRNEYIEM